MAGRRLRRRCGPDHHASADAALREIANLLASEDDRHGWLSHLLLGKARRLLRDAPETFLPPLAAAAAAAAAVSSRVRHVRCTSSLPPTPLCVPAGGRRRRRSRPPPPPPPRRKRRAGGRRRLGQARAAVVRALERCVQLEPWQHRSRLLLASLLWRHHPAAAPAARTQLDQLLATKGGKGRSARAALGHVSVLSARCPTTLAAASPSGRTNCATTVMRRHAPRRGAWRRRGGGGGRRGGGGRAGAERGEHGGADGGRRGPRRRRRAATAVRLPASGAAEAGVGGGDEGVRGRGAATDCCA